MKPTVPGAVILDFDGVIADSEMLHLRCFNAVLAPLGVEISKQDYYRKYLGLTDVECLQALADEGAIAAASDQIPSLVREKNRLFSDLAATEGNIIPGVRDFLGMVETNGIPMAICSGALRVEIELILDDANLRHHFEVIVSAEQVKKGKPDPQGFLLAMEKLARKRPLSADRCVAVEDSRWGLEAAKTAGMRTVAVTNSYEADQLQTADMIVDVLDKVTIEQLSDLCGPAG